MPFSKTSHFILNGPSREKLTNHYGTKENEDDLVFECVNPNTRKTYFIHVKEILDLNFQYGSDANILMSVVDTHGANYFIRYHSDTLDGKIWTEN